MTFDCNLVQLKDCTQIPISCPMSGVEVNLYDIGDIVHRWHAYSGEDAAAGRQGEGRRE